MKILNGIKSIKVLKVHYVPVYLLCFFGENASIYVKMNQIKSTVLTTQCVKHALTTLGKLNF